MTHARAGLASQRRRLVGRITTTVLAALLLLVAVDGRAQGAPAGPALVDVPATGHRVTDTMAVFLSGDGGWAALDKDVSARLAAEGIPVVGWSSLVYYWSPRSPDEAAAELARIVRQYTVAWARPRVIVIGYSFGADVAPFLVNRLPADVRARIDRLALLAPSEAASFEFHVSEWIGRAGDQAYPTRAELVRLEVPTICIYPRDEQPTVCRAGGNPRLRPVTLGTGHHFSYDYRRLTELILREPRQ